MHALTLLYHQGNGGKKLFVEYEGPGIARTFVPPSVLFHDKRLVKVLAPAVHDSVAVGEVLAIQWQADTSVTSVMLDVSIDPPSTWTALTSTSIGPQDTSWGTYSWLVPQQLGQTDMHARRVVVRVRSASDSTVADASDHTIYVYDPSSTRWESTRGHEFFTVRGTARGCVVDIPQPGTHSLEVVAANGRVIARRRGWGRSRYVIGGSRLGPGVYVVRLTTPQGTANRKVLVGR
jgi:hypothetical protein